MLIGFLDLPRCSVHIGEESTGRHVLALTHGEQWGVPPYNHGNGP